MARCRCAVSQCSCIIEEADGISVTGVGTRPDPYVISVVPDPASQLPVTATADGVSVALPCVLAQDCLIPGDGVARGGPVVSARLAPAPNGISIGTDGGLFAEMPPPAEGWPDLWFFGAGPPPTDITVLPGCRPNDWYLNTLTGEVYRLSPLSVWQLNFTLGVSTAGPWWQGFAGAQSGAGILGGADPAAHMAWLTNASLGPWKVSVDGKSIRPPWIGAYEVTVELQCELSTPGTWSFAVERYETDDVVPVDHWEATTTTDTATWSYAQVSAIGMFGPDVEGMLRVTRPRSGDPGVPGSRAAAGMVPTSSRCRAFARYLGPIPNMTLPAPINVRLLSYRYQP